MAKKRRALLAYLHSIFILAVSILSCKPSPEASSLSDVEYGRNRIIDSVVLEKTSELRFDLDTLTNAVSSSLQIYPRDNPAYLLFHHRHFNRISVYDLKSGKLLSKILPEEEGPNGVGYGIDAAYVQSFDSIFLFSILEQRLFLIDSSGVLKKRIQIENDQGYAMLGSIFPPIIKDSSIYLCAYPPPYGVVGSHNFSGMKINLYDGKILNIWNLSKQYDLGAWGKHHYLRVHHIYNDITDQLISSFPNDPYIYVSNPDGRMIKYPGQGKRMGDMHPLKNIDEAEDDDKIFRLESSQGCYSAIFFDRWRNVYYRLAFNPILGDYQSPFDTEKHMSLIIFDRVFNKIGEHFLEDDTYSYMSVFVSPDGIHLLNRKRYHEDENHLTFDTYRLVTR